MDTKSCQNDQLQASHCEDPELGEGWGRAWRMASGGYLLANVW